MLRRRDTKLPPTCIRLCSMNRLRDIVGLMALAAVWACWPNDKDRWVDPLGRGESAGCEGRGSAGVTWRMQNDGDCGGTYRILFVRTGRGKELTATVINGQILLDRISDPPRFRVVQPILWDSNSRYPYGRPGTWTIEYHPGGYRWR